MGTCADQPEGLGKSKLFEANTVGNSMEMKIWEFSVLETGRNYTLL